MTLIRFQPTIQKKRYPDLGGMGMGPIAQVSGANKSVIAIKNTPDPGGGPYSNGQIAGNGDYLRMKAWNGSAINDTWVQVSGTPVNAGAYSLYTITRVSGPSATFLSGTSVIRYPASGGFLYITSDDTNGPFYSVLKYASNPWNSTTEVGRFGNMGGAFGVASLSNYYGFGAGDYAGGNYIKYDQNGGFLLKAGGGKITINASGIAMTADTTDLSVNTIGWYSGASFTSGMVGIYNASHTCSLLIQAAALVAADGTSVEIDALGTTSFYSFVIVAPASNGNGYANFLAQTGTFAGVMIGGSGGVPSAMLDVRGSSSLGGSVTIPNNTAILFKDSGGTARNAMYITPTNNMVIQSAATGATINLYDQTGNLYASFSSSGLTVGKGINIGTATGAGTGVMKATGPTGTVPIVIQAGTVGNWQLGPNGGAGSADNTFSVYSATYGANNGSQPTLIESTSGDWRMDHSLQVGRAPTGGDKGQGTINVSANIYLNGTAYTNPAYALEYWVTGRIKRYANRPGAAGYARLALDEAERYIREHYELPGHKEGFGLFDGGDWLLEKLEELFTYAIEMNHRIDQLAAR